MTSGIKKVVIHFNHGKPVEIADSRLTGALKRALGRKPDKVEDYFPEEEESGEILLIQAKVPRELGFAVREDLRAQGVDWKTFITAALRQYKDKRGF